jgi:hypothetical protein
LAADSPTRRRRVVFALAALLAVGLVGVNRAHVRAAEPAAWEPATTWALLVGVLSWQDPKLSTFPTKGRVDRVLEQALLDRGVPRDHVTFLEDEEATLEHIRAAFDATIEAAGEGSTLLLYYAGHGSLEGRQVHFANYDVESGNFAKTAWGAPEIAARLKDSWKGKRLILLADCCHSGGLRAVVDAVAPRAGLEAACITSALDCNLSTGNWTFTQSVVAGLRGNGRLDRDDDLTVTFGELDAFVHQEMRFREGQLTEWYPTKTFSPSTRLSRVDRSSKRVRAPGPWQVGDFVEVQWKDSWYRAEVLETKPEAWKVRYQGFDATDDEWVPASRLRAPTPLNRKKGDLVEVEWKKAWWPATVLEVREDFAFVRYDDFGDEWDEWATAKRMRPRSPK